MAVSLLPAPFTSVLCSAEAGHREGQRALDVAVFAEHHRDHPVAGVLGAVDALRDVVAVLAAVRQNDGERVRREVDLVDLAAGDARPVDLVEERAADELVEVGAPDVVVDPPQPGADAPADGLPALGGLDDLHEQDDGPGTPRRDVDIGVALVVEHGLALLDVRLVGAVEVEEDRHVVAGVRQVLGVGEAETLVALEAGHVTGHGQRVGAGGHGAPRLFGWVLHLAKNPL